MPIKLLAIDGHLHINNDDVYDPALKALHEPHLLTQLKQGTPHWVVLIRYEAGDADCCPWPFTDPEHETRLRTGLYDAREIGLLPPHLPSVLLPDDTTFEID